MKLAITIIVVAAFAMLSGCRDGGGGGGDGGEDCDALSYAFCCWEDVTETRCMILDSTGHYDLMVMEAGMSVEDAESQWLSEDCYDIDPEVDTHCQ
jgi:hypothetical protein